MKSGKKKKEEKICIQVFGEIWTEVLQSGNQVYLPLNHWTTINPRLFKKLGISYVSTFIKLNRIMSFNRFSLNKSISDKYIW